MAYVFLLMILYLKDIADIIVSEPITIRVKPGVKK